MEGTPETWAELYDLIAPPSLQKSGLSITPIFPKTEGKTWHRLGRGLDQIVVMAQMPEGAISALGDRYELRAARGMPGYKIVGYSRNSLWTRLLGETILVHEERRELRLDLRLHSKGALLPLETVVERVASFANGLAESGFSTCSPWLVCRYDVALDLLFADREVGLRFLEAVSRLRYTKGRRWAWKEAPTYGYVRNRAAKFRPVGCVYDKGIESGKAASGSWVRVEARKFMSRPEDRIQLATLTPGAMRYHFGDVFLDACPEPGVHVDTRRYAVTLAELVRDEKIDRRQYEALAGYLLAERAGTVPLVYKPETARRMAQAARRLGIAYQGAEAPEGFDLDVWSVLREFVAEEPLPEL